MFIIIIRNKKVYYCLTVKSFSISFQFGLRNPKHLSSDPGTKTWSHIELYDPEQGDEEQVKGHEEAEGPPHSRDARLLPGLVRLQPGVQRPHPPAVQPRISTAAAPAIHVWPRPLSRVGSAPCCSIFSGFPKWNADRSHWLLVVVVSAQFS